jgi:hypothetical protein
MRRKDFILITDTQIQPQPVEETLSESKTAPFTIPENVRGLRLCKMKGDDLLLCETVLFKDGHHAVDTILRRASICGEVGPVGEIGDQWADLMQDESGWLETIKLDAAAWRSLKDHWMRCKYVKVE